MSVGSTSGGGGGVAEPLHVPAWKRIGLKLKYANDTEQINSQVPEQTVREGASGVDAESRPSKKRKRDIARVSATTTNYSSAQPETEIVTSTEIFTGGGVTTRQTNGDHAPQSVDVDARAVGTDQTSATGSEAATKSKSRRKSVTFAPDAKDTDDTTADDVDVNTRNAIAAPTTKHEKSATSLNANLDAPQSKANKRTRKPKGKSDPDQTSAVQETPAYITYLQSFAHDRSNWKFNKAKQNDLLKYAFDTDRIAPQYTADLLAYLAGLQGAAAQKRLIDGASTIVKDLAIALKAVGNLDDMESHQARREAYRGALRQQLERFQDLGAEHSEYDDQQLREMKSQEERGIRAESILEQLLRNELYPDENQTTPKHAHGLNKEENTDHRSTAKDAKGKSRKARTQDVSSSSSSSSESDGSSDSSSEGQTSNKIASTAQRGPSTVSEALKVTRQPPQFAFPPRSQRPAPKNLPEAPAYGPAASGAIPAGFQTGSTSNNNRKKFFDDDLLDEVFPKLSKRKT